MKKRMSLLLVVGVFGCTGEVDTGEPVVELQGPVLDHTPPDEELDSEGEIRLEVAATDPEGVRAVTLYHRTSGSDYWDSSPMDEADDGWFVDIDSLQSPGFEYYFKATDDGESPATSYLPETATSDPFVLEVLPSAQSLPWLEDFELLPEESSLFTMDWWSPTEGFDGYAWEIYLSDGFSGDSCAWHQRGAASVGELSDWLVSPALDFGTLERIMVRWVEKGSSAEFMGSHELYISTNSRDIASGDFELVDSELPAPDDDWLRSESYDLTEWAGAPVVYLAWRYVGEAADDWFIDDIEVLELAPELEAVVTWDPDPVHPGETAGLTFSIDNHTAAEATDLTAYLSLPEGGGTVSLEEQPIALIEAEGSVQLEYELVLDESLADNRALPLLLTLDDGTDVWDFDLEMMVGLPSEASLSLSLTEDASLQWILGVGDPDDPSWSITAHAGLVESGSPVLTADITDAYELLPPEPGPMRWFSRVSADVDGTIESFAIVYGGETHVSRTSNFDVDEPAMVYVPEPPDPVIYSVSPTEVSPGESEIALSFFLRNDGADTAGPVEATVYSLDDDASVVGGDGLVLTSDVWSEDALVGLSGPLLTVSSEHVDSTPLSLAIDFDDGVETWTEEFAIDVPWPVLKISYIEIEDSGGDGILDSGETATLEIEVTNTGGMETFGTVDGVLSIESESTATVVLTEDEGYFGSFNVGTSRDDDDFALQVISGSTGDTVALLLTLDDGTESYEARTTLTLGEPPWQSLSAVDDDIGDVLSDYPFDIVNGQYRIVDGRVEMILESAEPYDSSTLFLEAWGTSSGADYLYYRWVLQAGGATFQGYDSSDGFSIIGTMDVDFIDDTHVGLSWELEPMGLFSDSFSLGWAAGWCGPDTYYCDHFPNGWGYPYVSFSTSGWHDVEW